MVKCVKCNIKKRKKGYLLCNECLRNLELKAMLIDIKKELEGIV